MVLTQVEYDIICYDFSQFDAKGDGLDSDGLKAMLEKQAERPVSDEELDSIRLQTGDHCTLGAYITALYGPGWRTDLPGGKVFDALDRDGSGKLDATELMQVVAELGSDLSEGDVLSLIQDVDVNSDGVVDLEEFMNMLDAPQPPKEGRPHLELHFDVNQTIIMIDSAAKADASALLNTVLSNSAWGRSNEAHWEPAGDWAVAVESPEAGLVSYCEHVCSQVPMEGLPKEEQKVALQKRRELLRTFTDAGQPGAGLKPHLDKLSEHLMHPAAVSGASNAAELNLESGAVLLLPSFLHCLRRLKAEGRSFSVCFRTFGLDLKTLLPEYNAMCEGKHPLFKEEDALLLDGSDGGPDMRVDLNIADSHGTWVRNQGALLLALGTFEQPKPGEPVWEFFDGQPNAKLVTKPAALLSKRLATPCTLALRDYYPGWAAAGRSARGGKPLLLESRQTHTLQVFFDDHILPGDAHIVDVRLAHSGSAVPIQRLYASHLVRAEPLLSMAQRDYFVDKLTWCEQQWRASLERRHKLAKVLQKQLKNLGAVAKELHRTPSTLAYHSYTSNDVVKKGPKTNAIEDYGGAQ